MRIAFVSDAAYPWNIGGIENILHAQAVELAKLHEVHFFSMKWPGMKNTFKSENITYHANRSVTTDTFYRHGRRSIREAVMFSLGLFRIFSYKFDVIISNQFPVLQLPVLELYCKLTGCKLILEVAEVWQKAYWTEYLGGSLGGFAHFYASTFMRLADSYIATSTVTANDLANTLGIDKKKMHVFAPVLDDESIRKLIKSKEHTQQRVVFFGRLIKEKRLDKWLRVINVARKKLSLKAAIYGEGPEKSSIEKSVKMLNLEKVVSVNGFAKRRDFVYKEMMKSSLFLQMSEREGLSIVVLESIAMGTPVVLPSYSPIPDEVKRMCVVVDELEIAEKVVEIIKSKDKSSYISNKDDIKYFSKSHIGGFFSDLFNSMKLNK